MHGRLFLAAIFALGVAVLVTPAGAQDKPRYGGELIFAVPSEMPSYDGHREGTFGMVHPLAPHYNTLLRVDPNDRTGTKIVSDLAESWAVSSDGRRVLSGGYDRTVRLWTLPGSQEIRRLGCGRMSRQPSTSRPDEAPPRARARA